MTTPTFFSFFEKLSYKKLFLLIFCVCIGYVLPILLANTYYIDDMNRTTEGYNWNRDGRFISSALMHLLSMQHEIVYSFFPYATVLSAFLLAVSGFLTAFYLGVRDKFCLFTAAVLLATCPFLLEVLTYKFDCLPIALSVLFAVLPFHFYGHKLKFFVASCLFLYLVFGLYQTTAFSYAMVLCFFSIQDVWKSDYKKMLLHGLLSVTAFVAAFALYTARLKHLDFYMVDAQRGEFIFSDPEFWNLLAERWNGYKELVFSLLGSSYRYVFFLASGAALAGLLCFFIRQKKSKETIFQMGATLALTAFVLVLSVGVNLVVYEARWSPRSLIGYGFVVLLLFLAVMQLPKPYAFIGKITFLPLIFYSFLISSQFGMFLKNQEEFSDFMIGLIAPDILKHPDLKLVIDGKIRYAPRNSTVHYGTMPIIYKLAPVYENNYFYWGIIRMNKFGMMSNEYVSGAARTAVLENKQSYPLVQDNKYFTLHIREPYAVITFH